MTKLENLASFNHRAHGFVMNVFDIVEETLIENDLCSPYATNEYLTLLYIEEASCFLRNAQTYIDSEGKIAAEIFFGRLTNHRRASKFKKHSRICGQQISMQPVLYFPRFYEILTKAYVDVLRTSSDLNAAMFSGTVLLAAATLPDVRLELRREFRRRGLRYDRLLVKDDVMATRLKAALLPSGLSKTCDELLATFDSEFDPPLVLPASKSFSKRARRFRGQGQDR
jgi:hypothetical protein